ncbi:hypothetical protein Hanom_Chr01g00037661 [Helianthus anomalus]
MKGWTNGCGFTNGWLKVVEEVPIPIESWLVFTMIASKTFELSVFHPETGTEICFKKADVVVLYDSVYGDDGFDLLIVVQKFDVNIHLFDNMTLIFLDSGEVDLDDAEIGTMSVDDGLFNSKVVALIDESDVKSVPRDHSVKIVDDVKDFSVRDTFASPSVVSNVNVEKTRNLRGKTIAPGKQAVHRPCKVHKLDLVLSTSKSVLHFTKQAEHRLVSFYSPYFVLLFNNFSYISIFYIIHYSIFCFLASAIRCIIALDLHTDNLKPVKIQNLKGEVEELLTRSEKANSGFRYIIVGWPAYLDSGTYFYV